MTKYHKISPNSSVFQTAGKAAPYIELNANYETSLAQQLYLFHAFT